MNDRIKQLLQELGTAINEAISNSGEVNRYIQRVRDEGYDLYVVLDATIGLNKQEPDGGDSSETSSPANEVQFRINVNDLAMLRGLGIDPTRKVRGARKAGRLIKASDD